MGYATGCGAFQEYTMQAQLATHAVVSPLAQRFVNHFVPATVRRLQVALERHESVPALGIDRGT